MDIVVSANNNQEILVFPVVPPDTGAIEKPAKNEIFETINQGELNLIGNLGLRSLSIDSFFPNKPYSWIKKGSLANGWAYVDFFDRWRAARVPIRIVITTKDGQERLNMPCTVENFTHVLDKAGDIKYTLELKEYSFVKVN